MDKPVKNPPLNFTTTRLQALEGRAARYDVRDAKVNGLVLRVTPAGVKTFSVYRWVPAKRRPERITIGKFPEVSIDLARKRAEQVIGQISVGISPATQKRSIHDEDTLAEVFKKYLEHMRGKKRAPKTVLDTQSLFDNHIVPSRLHTRQLSDIQLTDVEKLHFKIGATQETTANKVAGLIRAIYNYAQKRGAKVVNPARGVERYQLNSRDRFLSTTEMPRFLASVKEAPQPFQDMFMLLLLTGVRLTNLLGARFDQFDLAHGIWSIPGAQHKNKKPHSLPLLPEAIEIVQRARERNDDKANPWLWPSSSTKSGHVPNVRNEWKRMLERAGIAGLTRHDIRRTVGSWMAIDGTSLKLIGAALGHTAVQSTQVYARLTVDPVRAALAKAVGNMRAAGLE